MPVLLLLFLTLLSVKVFVPELYHEGVTVITLVYIPFYSFIVMNGDIKGGGVTQTSVMPCVHCVCTTVVVNQKVPGLDHSPSHMAHYMYVGTEMKTVVISNSLL